MPQALGRHAGLLLPKGHLKIPAFRFLDGTGKEGVTPLSLTKWIDLQVSDHLAPPTFRPKGLPRNEVWGGEALAG